MVAFALNKNQKKKKYKQTILFHFLCRSSNVMSDTRVHATRIWLEFCVRQVDSEAHKLLSITICFYFFFHFFILILYILCMYFLFYDLKQNDLILIQIINSNCKFIVFFLINIKYSVMFVM